MINNDMQKNYEQKIKQLQQLTRVNIEQLKGKTVVLLIGPSGSGKSVLMNIAAGSEISCQINEEDNEWKISATPNVAPIGHYKSQTFIPNQISLPSGLVVYDCPGFKDTRGVVYDISKSWILKQVGINAQKMKVIFIGDLPTIKSVRGGQFLQIIKQMKQFIKDFDLQKDCQIIITKADKRTTSKNICNRLSKLQVPVQLQQAKITIFSCPDQETMQLPQINIQQIINRCPTIQKNCEIPLSNQAKLLLQNLMQYLCKQIHKLLKILQFEIHKHLLLLYSTNLEQKGQTIELWHQTFKKCVQDFQNCQNNLTGFTNAILDLADNLYKIQSQNVTLQIRSVINKIQDRMQQFYFLQNVLDRKLQKIQQWKELVKVNQQTIQRKQVVSKFKTRSQFIAFLTKLKINLSKPIKEQVHNIFAFDKDIETLYSGSKSIEGVKSYRDSVPYQGTQTYQGTVQFNTYIQYTGQEKYQGNIEYNGMVQTENCSHKASKIFGMKVGGKCLLCSHNMINIPYKGTVAYQGVAKYAGSVPYNTSVKYSGLVEYHGSKEYTGQVYYKYEVPYKNVSISKCKDHHICSCKNLGMLIRCCKAIAQDIIYFNKLHSAQLQFLGKKAQKFKIQQQAKDQIVIAGVPMLFSDEVQQAIHRLLTKSHSFVHNEQNYVDFKEAKTYKGEIEYQGSQPYTHTVNHLAQKVYNGQQPFEINQPYKGQVQCRTCYGNCLLSLTCKDIKTFYKDYQGTVEYKGRAPYKGLAQKHLTKQVKGQVKYNGVTKYVGQTPIQLKVLYQHAIEVTCKDDRIGLGHHSCTSCDAWVTVVQRLDDLLLMKQALQNKIKTNSDLLQQLNCKVQV